MHPGLRVLYGLENKQEGRIGVETHGGLTEIFQLLLRGPLIAYDIMRRWEPYQIIEARLALRALLLCTN